MLVALALVSLIAVAGVCLVWVAPALAETVFYGDGTMDAKKSFGGSGQLTMFDTEADTAWLNQVELFGGRYGTPTPPDEDFHLYIVDGEMQVIRQIALPYMLWGNTGDMGWVNLPIPPTQVPAEFGVGVDFHAHQTKGIYVGLDNSQEQASYIWLPGGEPKSQEGANWMFRIALDEEPNGDPDATDLVILKDEPAFMDTLAGIGADGSSVNTKTNGEIPTEGITTVRLGAVSSPSDAATASVWLNSGLRIECTILSANDKTVKVRTGSGTEMSLDRGTVTRIDFH